MSTATPPPGSELHEVLAYIRAKQRVDGLSKLEGAGMIMKRKTPLAKALDAMSCIPFIQISFPFCFPFLLPIFLLKPKMRRNQIKGAKTKGEPPLITQNLMKSKKKAP